MTTRQQSFFSSTNGQEGGHRQLIVALLISLSLPVLVTVLLHGNFHLLVREALRQLFSILDAEPRTLALKTLVAVGALLVGIGVLLFPTSRALDTLLFVSYKPESRVRPPEPNAKTSETLFVPGEHAHHGGDDIGGTSAHVDEIQQVPPVVQVDESSDDFRSAPLLLSPSLLQQLALHVVPHKLWDYRWKRLYSLSRDGDCWATVVAALSSGNWPTTLWVVRTRRDAALLGALADATWKIQDGPLQFHGGPGAKLFRVVQASGVEPKVECFPWTGANRYCQLLDRSRQRIVFGAGTNLESHTEGIFGLSLERDFLEGTTATCATFDNPPLCHEPRFAIVDVEIYGFKMW